MSNTHAIADTAYELQATCEDLLPACVISTTWPTVPVSSMTLSAFATQAYVRDGQALVYVDQPAITLTLTGSDGTYWLAVSRDTSAAYASWTRRPGSHYMWRLSGTRPPDLDGLLVFASCTVAGGVITAVTPAPGVTLAEAWRARAGLGTMAVQNANAVAITGGTAQFTNVGIANSTPIYPLDVTGQVRVMGTVGIQRAPASNVGLFLEYARASQFGVILRPSDADTGNPAVTFYNVANTTVGSITTTGSATAYNTSSDVRLKFNVTSLLGAMDVVRALRPVSFFWQADGSKGTGFLAHELMKIIPEAVSGLPDEVNADGSIKPQQVDHSRLVVFLVGAVQELLKRVEVLEELVTTP